ncbi:MAG: hypothetical protein AB3N16_15155 [Flavobacteriaceae bacterium]
MKDVIKINNKDYLRLHDTYLNYFEITGREAVDDSKQEESFHDWEERALTIGNFKVIPFGSLNDIPNQIQEAVFPNSLAPRIQGRKVELLFEQGPYLYKQVVDGRKYFRQPIEDPKLQEWLLQNNWEEALLHNCSDFYYQNEVFMKVYRERSGRLSAQSSSPATLEAVDAFDCRLGYLINDKKKKPTHVLIGDWKSGDTKEIQVYPLFDPSNPTKYPVAIHRSKKGSYGMRTYTLPEIYGSLEWIRRSTSIPKVFKALTENSLNIKWHIQSPAKFWDDKRKILKDNCKAQKPPVEYREQMLVNLQKKILDKLSELLSGVENVGKFWHNEYVVELIGANAMEHGWKITPIEQKTKEYVESQIKISDKADYSTVAGLGLHSALGNVGADGKSHTGGEQIYALKIHQITSVGTPEYFVCKAFNDILRFKFKTDIRIGFYHLNPERSQDITQSQRTLETNPSENNV